MTTHPDLMAARAEIDDLDFQLISLLAKRQAVVERVIGIKQREKLPANIPARVKDVIERAERNAKVAGLSPELARSLWTTMVDWFVSHEAKVLGR
jgi:isochorismate pyruvate lyase